MPRGLELQVFPKPYYGTCPNAVKTKIWIAVCDYLMLAILHKQLELPGTLHRALQLLTVHLFEKISIHEVPAENEYRDLQRKFSNQLML